ncbi:transposase [Nodularia phage vB_NspS-kac65v151]|uniref:Transposase n=1 Tax=Nodularia phage vB_NspS-kac65v151 TaxID=2557579 RepID=A0A482MHR3_9CAUD|nr:transposase [Nodularia phage vB_NspS-kac65v151]QBQ73096.1 transposase [Nodularia phage vB_NspS-kac65v151]
MLSTKQPEKLLGIAWIASLVQLFLVGMLGKKTALIWERRLTKSLSRFLQVALKKELNNCVSSTTLQFVETEESYTSKASFIDRDFLPTFGEKPEGWKESGKRVKRGLYRTAQGYLINADCNGAANMGRKNVAVMLGLNLSGISRGDLSAPLRLKLWS